MLSEVRAQKEHLHHGNFGHTFYRKNQLNMETRAPNDLSMQVARYTQDQLYNSLTSMIAVLEF